MSPFRTGQTVLLNNTPDAPVLDLPGVLAVPAAQAHNDGYSPADAGVYNHLVATGYTPRSHLKVGQGVFRQGIDACLVEDKVGTGTIEDNG